MKKILLIILVLVSLQSFGQAVNIFKGPIKYDLNYVGWWSARSIPDKNYVDSSRNKARDSVATLVNAITPYNITTNGGEILGYRSVNQTGSFGVAPTTGSSVLWTDAGKWRSWYNGTSNEIVEKSSTVASNTVSDGVTTPTATSVSNCSSSSATPAQWLRVGNSVTVSGTVTTTVTTAATLTIVDVSFPVASAITDYYQCIGWSMTGSNVIHGSVQGNTTNDRAQIIFTPSTTGSQTVSYQYTYRIL
jgi:hypothetical protein